MFLRTLFYINHALTQKEPIDPYSEIASTSSIEDQPPLNKFEIFPKSIQRSSSRSINGVVLPDTFSPVDTNVTTDEMKSPTSVRGRHPGSSKETETFQGNTRRERLRRKHNASSTRSREKLKNSFESLWNGIPFEVRIRLLDGREASLANKVEVASNYMKELERQVAKCKEEHSGYSCRGGGWMNVAY
jgi:hypothetical protein